MRFAVLTWRAPRPGTLQREWMEARLREEEEAAAREGEEEGGVVEGPGEEEVEEGGEEPKGGREAREVKRLEGLLAVSEGAKR